jgi:heptosyltransferase II
MLITFSSKIQNIFLLCLCITYSFVRGKADKKIIHPKNVLVVQMAKLGDMICTTPVFRAVKEKCLESKLYVVGNSINKEILFGNTDVDEYIIHDERKFWNLVLRLRKEKIDFACQTAPNFGFLAALYLAGIPSIATPKIENGFCPWETKAYKTLRRLVISVPHRMGSYAPREYLRLLEPIGIRSENTNKYIFFSKEAGEKAEVILVQNEISKDDFLVCISPSAGNKIKQWPADRFAEVADYVYGTYGVTIFVIGYKNDRPEVMEMIRGLHGKTKVINTLDELNLDELKALISKMNMLVSVDTGPIYIAEALGVPTVDITGPIDEREQPPISPSNRIVHIQNRKKPELYVMNARTYDKEEARRQTEEITVKMVTDEIDDLINYLKKNEGEN